MTEKNPLPFYTRGEEIMNMVTHVVGGGLGIVALVLCLVKSILYRGGWEIASSLVYGISIILLFTMSSIYHGLIPVRAKKVFRVLDHCTIYLLIAGTYTPILLVSLREYDPLAAWVVFAVIWTTAVVAVTLTAVNMHRFRIFSMIAYLAMGWSIVLCMRSTIQAVGSQGMWLIFIGGILYTIGAILYGISKKKTIPYAHGIFHFFVLFACILHFIAIFFFIL